jgi:hypothetical protein
MMTQKGCRVRRLREGGAEEFVVRLVQGIVGHGVARPAEENATAR